MFLFYIKHYFLIKCGAILHLNVFPSFIFSIVSQFFFSMLFVNFFSTIFLLDFGNVPIVWYVFHFFTLPFVLFLWYLVVQTRQKWLECENRNKDHPPSSQCFGNDMVYYMFFLLKFPVPKYNNYYFKIKTYKSNLVHTTRFSNIR